MLPVEPVVDTMEYAAEVMPRFNLLNARGYHIRDAGSTAVCRKRAPTIAAALYTEAARERGIDPDRLAPRVVLLNVHNDFLEEVKRRPPAGR